MNNLPEKIICEKDQKYSCINCDDVCCKSFSIKIDYKTKKRLENIEYIYKLVKDANCDFEKALDGSYYLPIVQEDSGYKCLFYDSKEKCIIHNRNCFNDKPVSCQAFPFSTYLDSKNNVHIETSFRCKSILENYGNNLDDIKGAIVSNVVNLEYYPKEFSLDSIDIQQTEVFELADKLKNILADESIPLENSVFKYFRFIKEYKNKHKSNFSILDTIVIKDDYDTYHLKPDYSQLFTKLIIGVYLTNLMIYSTYTRKNLLFKDVNQIIKQYSKLYFSIIQMKNNILLPSSGQKINLKDLPKVDFKLDNKSEELIRRYLKANVIRYKYMTMESTNLQFLNRVIIYFSLIKIVSKVFMLNKNQFTTDFSSISNAISLIELVFYHTKSNISPVRVAEKTLNSMLNKFLNQENTIYYLIKYGLM